MKNKSGLLETATYEDLRWGYRKDPASGVLTCICCGKSFEPGEIYPIGDRYFDASGAIRYHLETDHSDRFERLLRDENPYNPLNENQRNCLSLFQKGLSVVEVAQTLSLSPQTVRQYKFQFRKRARASRLYLALYEMALGGETPRRSVVRKEKAAPSAPPVHVVIERPVTDEERDQILASVFETLEPLKLRDYPDEEKRRAVVLTKIAEQFEPKRTYAEKEVNRILRGMYHDYVALRRDLVAYGNFDRVGRTYRRR